jgi:hypothetical protein
MTTFGKGVTHGRTSRLFPVKDYTTVYASATLKQSTRGIEYIPLLS